MRYDLPMVRTMAVEETPPERVKFTVYRDTWARGGRPGSSLLDPEDGWRCCLGHLARDLGVSDDACAGRTYFPRRKYDENLEEVPDPRIDRYRRIVESAQFVRVNDDPNMSDVDREALLTEMFSDSGVDVSFVDTAG